jgi:transcriptional/translational regulatory protein YebC/TACO1
MDPDELTLKAIDAGAEDVQVQKGQIEIYTAPDKLEAVRKTLEQEKISVDSSELSMVPKTTIQLDEKAALQTLKLLDKLEELDDVQHVSSNVDFSDTVLEKYAVAA